MVSFSNNPAGWLTVMYLKGPWLSIILNDVLQKAVYKQEEPIMKTMHKK